MEDTMGYEGKKKVMQPFYFLDDETKGIILSLVEKCREIELGNVSFHYYHNYPTGEATFYLDIMKDFWQLIVGSGGPPHRCRDMYEIKGQEIRFDYSECD